jgi:branched-chain amino acid aminotransferase
MVEGIVRPRGGELKRGRTAWPAARLPPPPGRGTLPRVAEATVHLNGKLVPEAQALVSVWDSGFLHGASSFTTMLARKGVVFRLDRHLRRLLGTVALLGLRTDATAASLAAAVGDTLRANNLTEARVRVTLSPGSVREQRPTTLVTAEPLPDYPDAWYRDGIVVVVSSFKQVGGDPAFGHKTGCYLARVLARQEAAAKGAEEALWSTPDNRLAEACFCNLFLVCGGAVRTPPADTPVLPGVVREAVGELCAALGIEADDQTPLTVRDLLAAEEMFLTASVAGIRPVVRVERHVVGEGKPGPVTRRIMTAYRALVDRECSPKAGAGGAGSAT